MRTNRLFAGALGTFALALSLVSCSNEELEPGTQPGFGDGDYDTSYMSINISSVGNSGTRAITGDGYPEGAEYENGSGDENDVQTVRVYFFDEKGDPAPVRKVQNGFVSYFDFVKDDIKLDNPSTSPNGPVEKIISAQIVLQTPNGDNVHPAVWCAAVINNVPTGIQDEESINNNLSLDQLQRLISNYGQIGKGNFVMSSSVYSDKAGTGGKEQIMVSVAGKIFENADDAKGTPVDIYVERTLARVDMDVNSSFETKTIKDEDDNEKTITISKSHVAKIDINGIETPVYVELLGWNVTATRQESYLIKNITPTWDADIFGSGVLWNAPNYFRSFWANSAPTSATNGYNFIDFENAQSLKLANHAYLQENTQQGITKGTIDNGVENITETPYKQFTDNKEIATPASKVILAAKLVKEDGSELELADIGGVKYAGFENLKKAVIAYLTGKMYCKTTTKKDGNTETSISDPTIDDIVIKTKSGNIPSSDDNASKDANKEYGNYYVTVELSESAKAENKSWYTQNNAEETTKIANVDDYIANTLPKIQIWKNGMTYYYADIKHLGNLNTNGAVGVFGVVRNHVYKFDITSITGLGTPVYDPKEIIYPEKPEKGNSFIAARIRVLSWRIVKNSTSLEW